MQQTTGAWWQETLAAIRRQDLPAAKRAAVRGITGQEDSRPWLALASVLRAMGDLRAAGEALEQGFARHSFHRMPADAPGAPRVLVLVPAHLGSLALMPDGSFVGGASVDWGRFLDGVFDQEFVPVEMLERHPEHIEALRRRNDVVVNLITDPDAARDSLVVAGRMVAELGLPVVNAPDRVLECGRASNHERLNAIPGLEFPRTFDIELPPVRPEALEAVRAAAVEIGYPFLLRRAGWHDGRFIDRIDRPEQIDSLALAPGGGRYHVIEFRDLAGEDGLYRKMRMYCIDGVWYPRHVFAGKSWNVHFAAYWELLQTGEAARLQEEEGEFLEHWRELAGSRGQQALAQLADVVGLDWFGMDCALLSSGDFFVFEVNPAMRVAGSSLATVPGREVLSQRFGSAVIDATRALVRKRAGIGPGL